MNEVIQVKKINIFKRVFVQFLEIMGTKKPSLYSQHVIFRKLFYISTSLYREGIYMSFYFVLLFICELRVLCMS